MPKLEEDALRSQLDELRGEVKHYEELRSGGPKTIHIDSFDELPRALVEARILAGLSQKDLAERRTGNSRACPNWTKCCTS